MIPIGFSRNIFNWLFTGLMGILIGTSIGASMMGQGEGVLLNSTLSINCFLIYISSFNYSKGLTTISSQFTSFSLMTNLRAIIIYASFLILIGVGICRDLIQRVIDEGLFNKRPPNDGFKTKYQQRVKNKRVNLRLLKATVALTCLPTFVFGGRESLSSDLNAYVGKVGYLQTGRLTESLKNRVKSDLATYPRNEGISTLKLAVVDTGASAICMKSKTSMIPGSYEELSKPIALGGISSGLEIIGKGKAAFELISLRGKKIRVVRDCLLYTSDAADE